MKWYAVSYAANSVFFLSALTIVILRILILLETNEIYSKRRSYISIGLFHGSIAVISLSLAVEILFTAASIEGGIYMVFSGISNYLSIIPLIIYIAIRRFSIDLTGPLELKAEDAIMPLLLPAASMVGLMQISFGLLLLFIIRHIVDSIRLLHTIWKSKRNEITRAAMVGIIKGMEQGVCVSDKGGRILEANDAFYDICKRIGIEITERLGKLYESIEELEREKIISISGTQEHMTIRKDSSCYLLMGNSFSKGVKKLVQVSLSDVTKLNALAVKLDKENDELKTRNRELSDIISLINEESAVSERELLSQSAHDEWSQRLAIAAMTIDSMIVNPVEEGKTDYPPAFFNLPDILGGTDTGQAAGTLQDSIRLLADTYGKLGVSISFSGSFDLPDSAVKVIPDVLREAFANAVRHAYARNIIAEFVEEDDSTGVIIRNRCISDNCAISEGRGLYDIKARVKKAGGTVEIVKSDWFILKVLFPIYQDTDKRSGQNEDSSH